MRPINRHAASIIQATSAVHQPKDVPDLLLQARFHCNQSVTTIVKEICYDKTVVDWGYGAFRLQDGVLNSGNSTTATPWRYR
jgi:hypothetical protein